MSGLLRAGMVEETVRYSLDGKDFVSTVVWEAGGEGRPGILMVPNWMGPTEASLEKARQVAKDGYVVMMVDMYGVAVRPENAEEASEAAGAVRSDREQMRARAGEGLEQLRKMEEIPLDADKVGAIGFCFGGGTVLELGRSGADLDAIISFHGDLLSPTLEADAGQTEASVLVLHGADDPYVPQEHVEQFVAAMQDTEVDWQLIQYGNAVHSFTDPQAAAPGEAEYDADTARRAFGAMEQLLEELW